MGESQIVVRLNPDVPPTGSCLGIVNAARKSFGRRSEWDYVSTTGVVLTDSPNRHLYETKKVLKDKDKRLLEFLARGMTADDFEAFVYKVAVGGEDVDGVGFTTVDMAELKELLWQWRNTPTHASPFGHAFMSFEIKVPMFLARQLVKHKFLRWSEYSRRYITDDVEFYVHDYRKAAKDKKQGSGGVHKNSPIWQTQAKAHNDYQLQLYNDMIEDGVAPEQARGVLPADLMTSCTWSGSFDAWADMCRLRLGSDAQKEAQFVAKEVYKHLCNQFPVAAPLLVEGVK